MHGRMPLAASAGLAAAPLACPAIAQSPRNRALVFVPSAPLAEGHTADADGRGWTVRLRSGLPFHDGQTVTARDCVVALPLFWNIRRA